MGGLEEFGGETGWELIGRIKEGMGCRSSDFSLHELMRYEERFPLGSRLGGYELRLLAPQKGCQGTLFRLKSHAFLGSNP